MTGVDATHQEERVELIGEVMRQVELIREAYGWLRVLTSGTSERRAAPLLTDQQLASAAAEARVERAERAAGALPPSPAPLSVGMVDAQIRVGRMVQGMVGQVAEALGQPSPGCREQDPASVVDALGWMVDTVPLQSGRPSPVIAVDRAGVGYRLGALELLHRVSADFVDLLLLGARDVADDARRAAGMVEQHTIPFPGGRCPACHGRALELDMTLRDERWWVVRCVSQRCVCTGDGCGCGASVVYEGRRHAWARGEFDRLQRAILLRGRQRPSVRAGAAGRGGSWTPGYTR